MGAAFHLGKYLCTLAMLCGKAPGGCGGAAASAVDAVPGIAAWKTEMSLA